MKRLLISLLVLSVVLSFAAISSATNGDDLISIGPISRSMGGVGIAAPQDAISAVFANPAAMCFGPYCPGSEVNFAGTMFMPKVKTKLDVAGTVTEADSHQKVYGIPAFGVSVPITNKFPLLRFGIAAYGVSGLGVDYRNTAVDNPNYYNFGPMGQFPLVSGEYTQLQIMKFAPSLAYQPNENLSLGMAVHIDYANLDLRSGSSFDYGLGVELGALYKLSDAVSLGATYITPQRVKHSDVADFNGDGTADSLTLESPQQIGVGVAFTPIPNTLLLEVDGKWLNWSNATGYKAFDWRDQWVVAVGAQFNPTKKLALRVGYNYGKNPVKEHDNFVGATPAGPAMTTVQGKMMPTYYYETFRIVGFPAIVQNHLTFGVGYDVSNSFALHAGYMHAFQETMKESGTNLAGQPVSIESTLSEDSVEFGLTWRF
ncbi:MAG: outer membrane protein transport protein [Candidatus Sulfobium sp.]|jgi:long-chain fatty acid transport protein